MKISGDELMARDAIFMQDTLLMLALLALVGFAMIMLAGLLIMLAESELRVGERVVVFGAIIAVSSGTVWCMENFPYISL